MNKKIIALVPAAGTGTRLGDALPKQYLDINGRPMIEHALMALAAVKRVTFIVVVLSPDDRHWDEFFAAGFQQHGDKIRVLRVGGPSRGESVANGLTALTKELAPYDWVMVHDAARPCLRSELVEQFIDELENDLVGGLLALPLSDTIKRDSGDQRVAETIPREGIWRAQTPQMFPFAMLAEGLRKMPLATDEAQAVESLGYQPRLVLGDSANLKVTYAPDLTLARMLLSAEE